MNDKNQTEFKFANELALKWFEIHAEQRLKVFNFFVLIAGFCIGGFFTAIQTNNRLAASTVALVLVFVCYCFKQLDRRTVQLTKLAEDFLKESLSVVEETLKSTHLNFVILAEQKGSVWSYRTTFNVLFWLFGVLGVCGVIFPWHVAILRCLSKALSST